MHITGLNGPIVLTHQNKKEPRSITSAHRVKLIFTAVVRAPEQALAQGLILERAPEQALAQGLILERAPE
ncbi:MAG TPA: hypothetical protein PLI09_22800, partial [Candidatus Hydrogenedentes bacterium]|nr:hypothetical protein [Candidatus Hydrogenedentota bacterium]